MNEVEIGGQLVPQQSFEAITQISSNRTLLVQKLSSRPTKPEPITGLKTVNEVFDHFKPNVKVAFDTEDGTSVDEELKFSTLGDFTKKGIVEQSAFLKDLHAQQDGYHKFMKQLKSNKILKTALQNPEAKQAYLQALQAMIQEIEQAE
ncbi:type VI secretion system contractile sheath small subunit [Tunicatimonas pelagia]|uniref:type VI secretion system contractile sheath small subunit n=1 Tax=Tunicatimonas pelagia TaxID=931531 RepID=UPI0026657E6D|nr:type VI secretion system contractile sheath small subunit [Tunicatimonas pelagia]WKN41300.1 type VI secretion system contractile sheath small subunit [Tunicatimonas pelagia]